MVRHRGVVHRLPEIVAMQRFSLYWYTFLLVQQVGCWTPLRVRVPTTQTRRHHHHGPSPPRTHVGLLEVSVHASTTALRAHATTQVWVDLRQGQLLPTTSNSSSPLQSPSSSIWMEEGADAILVTADQAADEALQKICFATSSSSPPSSSLSSSSSPSKFIVETPPTTPDGGQMPTMPRMYQGAGGQPVGAIVDVSTSSGQDAGLSLIGSVEWLVIACNHNGRQSCEETDATTNVDEGWLMIPAENLISACQGTGTKLAAMVQNAGDVGGLAGALQLGVDALCVDATRVNDGKLWAACLDARKERSLLANSQIDNDPSVPIGPRIVQGTCKRLATPSGKSTVLADRVCIDLLQSLKPTEGCWLGSSAKMMALVLSEAAQSSFVPSRPFRVNAGPVHSYVLMGDGVSTKYLSELRAGDEVLVLDTETGMERAVAIGRLKEEVRPCIQVELSVDVGKENDDDVGAESQSATCIIKGQIFVQQAETVRLGKRIGEKTFVRVTDLESGADDGAAEEEILLRVTELGTHVGKTYSGKVQEK